MQTYTTKKTPGLRNGDGKVKILPAFLLTLYITAMAVLISIVFFTDIIDPSSYLLLLASVGAPAIGIALCSMLTTSVKPLVPFCIIVAAMLFLGANITLSSMIASFFLLVAISAYLLRDKLWALVILATLGACGITCFVSSNVLIATSCAIFFPISIALCLSFKKRKQRVPSVCAMSLSLGITLIVLFVAWIYVKEGSISVSVFKTFFDVLKEGLISAVAQAFDTVGAELPAELNLSAVKDLTAAMINLSFNFFPAIFTIILFIVSYIIHSLYVSVISPTVTDTAEITNAITFHMSVAAAVLFLVSYVAALVLDYEGLHLYAAAAQNLYMILFPGLTLITFGTVRSLAKGHNASCLGSILYIAIYAMLFFFTSVTLVLASFAGAILVIASAMKARNKNKHDK